MIETIGNVLAGMNSAKPPSSPTPTSSKYAHLWLNAPLRKAPLILRSDPDGPRYAGTHEKIYPKQKEKIVALLDKERFPIYLFGPVGTGKSCAAVALYTHWPRPGTNNYDWDDPHFCVSAELTGRLARMESKGKEYKRIASANVFILDDIGRRKLTDEQAELLLEIIELRGNKPTIYTGNHPPEELAEKLGDDRISSRILRGMNTVEFTGVDRRLSDR